MNRQFYLDMAARGLRFPIGTECDVLSVPGKETTIKAKVQAMMTCDA